MNVPLRQLGYKVYPYAKPLEFAYDIVLYSSTRKYVDGNLAQNHRCYVDAGKSWRVVDAIIVVTG